jgi:hypothetical protein
MKTFKEFLDEVITLKTQFHAGHPGHEKEVARASKQSGQSPDAIKKLIHNMNTTKIHWDADKKKEKEAADLAYENPSANTIKYASKHKAKSPAVIAMQKFREGLKNESMMDRITRHEYGKGYEHGFAGSKPKQDDDAYLRGHKSGMMSRSMKPNKAK